VPIQPVEKIWMDGKLVDWHDATTHVLTHALHYVSGVFEGVRAYETKSGPAVFRLQEHIRRLFRSAHMYQIEVPFSPDDVVEGVKETIKGSKVELVDVRGDEIDQTRAKRNVEDILAARPDVSCLVGFYSYNTPRIYEVLKEAGKLDKIKIIGFDEDPITLGGVKEGSIVGTVVQQPFEWGYQGMKLMAKYIEGDKSGIPANGIIIVPGKVIDKSNVDDFMGQMKQMLRK
jgi:ABC-type sugar transport system substrate-binding protein